MSITNLLPAVPQTDYVSDGRSSTDIKVTKFSYIWTIRNFRFCSKETGEKLTSLTFPEGASNKLKWRLDLYPNGENEICKDYLSLYLVLVSSDKTEVRVSFKFSIINNKGEKTRAQERQNVYRSSESKRSGHICFIDRTVLFREADVLLADEKLILHCDINETADPVNIREQNIPRRFKIPECSLMNDMEQLFESHRLSDFIFSVNGQKFFVHKSILALRSPVFAAMFEHKMKEKNNNRVEITDVDAKVMKEVLRYVYTGKVRCLDKMAEDLLAAADKYALDRLKVLCEEAVCNNLSVDTASNILVLADLRNADQLKSQAMDFITLHKTEVMATSDFKKMVIHHPHLFPNQVSSLPGSPKRKSKLTYRLRNFTNFLGRLLD